jgi:CIC family chloride channel protein
MVASITASYFSQWLHADSIYTVKLTQRGVRFAEGRDLDIMQGVMVREVMREHPVTVNKDASVAELMALFQETNLLGFPVLDDNNKLWGIVTLQDVHHAESIEERSFQALTVADLAVRQPLTVYPDEPIWAAIQKMAPRDLARLPVVTRDDAATLCGVVSRSDILRAYDLGIVRKQRGRLLEQQVELRRQKENGYVDVLLREDDSCHLSPIRELRLPETVTVVSIKRNTKTIIPRGDTVLQSGDIVTIYGRLGDMGNLHDLLNSCPLPTKDQD